MTNEQIHALATRIADDLFTDKGNEATTVDLHDHEWVFLGILSKSAAIERITAVLTDSKGE